MMTGTMGRPRAFAGGLLAVLVLCGCASRSSAPFVVGIVNQGSINDAILESFKASLADQSAGGSRRVAYVDYGYAGVDLASIDGMIARVLASKHDAVLALGGTCIRQAALTLSGKGTPLVVAPASDSQLKDYVKDFRRPGGNVTGVRVAMDAAKLLEYLARIAPSVRRVVLPTSAGAAPTQNEKDLSAAAPGHGIELIVLAVSSAEELGSRIPALPEATAILLMGVPGELSIFARQATDRRIPIGSVFPGHLDQGALFTFSISDSSIGRQAARQMRSIIEGTSPSVIPVERAEFSVAINLKAATALGLEVPEDVLRAADRVLR